MSRYDPNCYELAKRFVSDPDVADVLAREIQELINEFIDWNVNAELLRGQR